MCIYAPVSLLKHLYYCMHSVKLIHSTPDGDNLVSYMARVSNPSNQNNTETSARLIKYLIKHKHWSPFEMVNMCVEIHTTRSIAAQILRHRSFSFQEFSQRYARDRGVDWTRACINPNIAHHAVRNDGGPRLCISCRNDGYSPDPNWWGCR